jgi:tetratricopeptide (TPR) repeat protein
LAGRALSITVMLLAVGCGAPHHTGLEQSLTDYRAGRFALAHERASDIARTSTGPIREQAAYVAGLSAYRLGDLEDAARRLEEAAASPLPATAAPARATLALVRLEEDRAAEAAALLREAAADLSGADREQAERYARAAARRAWSLERTRGSMIHPSSSPSSPPAIAAPVDTFALQVGAFKSRRRAEGAAATARKTADRAGLGPVEIVTRASPPGSTLHVVRFGRFATRAGAADVRARLGLTEYIVVLRLPAAR